VANVEELVEGVLSGDRTAVGRAITLVESSSARDRDDAQSLIAVLSPHAGSATRVGITGLPGAGKSTFIDALGTQLTTAGHKVAVLAVDPSSTLHGGSIMGDKTRMARLSADPQAFIRPSPSGGALGGVTRTTRETMVVLEAAGYDVVLVETVGVGQSETAVADMVDTFVVLAIGGAGDELQGIKKGVLELADIVVVNKADGENVAKAQQAAGELKAALHLVTPPTAAWQPPVLTASALYGEGLDLMWGQVGRHVDLLTSTGALSSRRQAQLIQWMWTMVEQEVLTQLRADQSVRKMASELEPQVQGGDLSAPEAAEQILKTWRAS